MNFVFQRENEIHISLTSLALLCFHVKLTCHSVNKIFQCWHQNWTSSLLFPSYRESAKRISKSIKQLPRTPVHEAADWIEYTQAQGGLPYLRPRGLDLPFYQLYLLDILLLIFMVVLSSFTIVRFLFRFTNSLFMVKTKEKTLQIHQL